MNSDPVSQKQLLLVVGSGRSGTSVMSSVLQRLGFYVPEPEVEPDASNPRGFGESRWVVDFHTRLLRRASVQTTDARPGSWGVTGALCMNNDVRSDLRRWLAPIVQQHDHVLIKDPRLLWFLPLWFWVGSDLGARVSTLTLLRHPAEVVVSKQSWYGDALPATNRAGGWINTMLYTERATRELPRCFVHFGDLLDDWTKTVSGVCESLRFDLLERCRTSDLVAAADLVDTKLRRSAGSWDNVGVYRTISDFADRVWSDLSELAKGEGADPSVELRLDAHRHAYIELYEEAEALAASTTLNTVRRERRRERPSSGPPNRRLRLGRRLPVRLRRLIPYELRRRFVGAPTWVRHNDA